MRSDECVLHCEAQLTAPASPCSGAKHLLSPEDLKAAYDALPLVSDGPQARS